MKVCFGSVIYPKVLPYFSDFIQSLKKQTYQDYTLVLVLDNVEACDIDSSIKDVNVELLHIAGEYSVAEIRKKMVDHVIEKAYDLLIFGDADDIFQDDRIERLVDATNSDDDFYYHQLLTFDGDIYFDEGLPLKLDSINHIMQYNFLGLTNTAVKLNHIKEYWSEFEIYDEHVFDWFFFYFLLSKGMHGMMVNDAFTKYRIYDSNYSVNDNHDLALMREIQVKKAFYRYHYQMTGQKSYLDTIEARWKTLETKEENQIDKDFGRTYWWSILTV